jgi:1,4-alpha-glucan branching enzyme
MGCEIGQYEEWNWQGSLRWDLLQYPFHRKLHEYVRALNQLYAHEKSMYEEDFHWSGFQWIDFHDIDSSVISFIRRSSQPDDFLLFVCNFTPLPRPNYDVGVPAPGKYVEVLNSDAECFGGSGVHNPGDLFSSPGKVQNRDQFLRLTLPPLAVSVFRRVG